MRIIDTNHLGSASWFTESVMLPCRRRVPAVEPSARRRVPVQRNRSESIQRGDLERHWGIFYYDGGTLKYSLSLASGKLGAWSIWKRSGAARVRPSWPFFTSRACLPASGLAYPTVSDIDFFFLRPHSAPSDPARRLPTTRGQSGAPHHRVATRRWSLPPPTSSTVVGANPLTSSPNSIMVRYHHHWC
jgi:hypothetical protein